MSNIPDMSSASLVSNKVKFIDFKSLHFKNIFLKDLHFSVIIFSKFKEIRFSQPSNILAKDSTFLVLNSPKSIFTKLLQFLNIPSAETAF